MPCRIDLAEKIAFLKQPASYPDVLAPLEFVETHMAWIFLAGNFAYKLKKPVKFDYLDFSTLDLRRVDCLREVSLNRRLAPGVYLGVVPLSVAPDGALRLGPGGEVVDWLVHMRRLPSEKMLDVRLRGEGVTEREARMVGVFLSEFYVAQPHFDISPDAYVRRFRRSIRANFQVLRQTAYGLPRRLVAELAERQMTFLREHSELFDTRVHMSRVVEGHGDLRPEHVCLEEPPVIFDCLEFCRSFRVQDAADELSFLAMECELLGSTEVGNWIFDTYSERTRDFPPADLVDFYKTYRACLRAKLAIRHLDDEEADDAKWIARATSYLHLAETYLPALQVQSL